MDFDDLNPRRAPAPANFAAPSSGSVPEVSLVFNTPPMSVTKVGTVHTKYLDIHDQNSLRRYDIPQEIGLRNTEHEVGRKERLVQNPESYCAKNVTSVSDVPITRIQKNDALCTGKGFIEKSHVHFANNLPQNRPEVLERKEHSRVIYGGNSSEVSSLKQKSSLPQNNYSFGLISNETCSTEGRERVPDRHESNIQCSTLQVGQITAMKHHHRNMMNVNQRMPSCHSVEKCENRTTIHPFYNQCMTGSQMCYANPDLKNHDITVNKLGTSGSDVSPHGNTNCHYHFPHPNSMEYGTCCPKQVPYIRSPNNFGIGNVCGCQCSTGVTMLPEVKKYSGGEHIEIATHNQLKKNIIDIADEILPVNGCPIVKQPSSSMHRYNHNSMTNLGASESSRLQQNCITMSHSTDENGETIQRAATQRKNGNYDNLLKKNPIQENQEEKTDKRSSDTSILQEIALMNQKQCSILQGLLQQVVVMQSDQMKILSEINEKLSNTRLLENNYLHKNAEKPAELSKAENSTQTSIIEISNEKCEERNEEPMTLGVNNSSKNMLENRNFHESVDSNKIEFPIKKSAQEVEHKSKKLQDRAVSWSAVHGVETVEESFTLHGVCVPTVVDQLPSSVHTMHLHVQDYNSSTSFDSVAETRQVNDNKYSENCHDNKGSWTLYDNIVGHVKKFLQTVPCEKNGNASQKQSQVEAIRFATIEKIRQLGVSVYENSTEIKEVNTAGRIQFDSKVASPSFHNLSPMTENCSSDGSLEIQTLALKYLQDDDLCELAKWNQTNKSPSILKTGQRSANISLATQHYLEKYHLLPVSTDCKDKCPNANRAQVCMEGNILDITTLKKQPKLL